MEQMKTCGEFVAEAVAAERQRWEDRADRMVAAERERCAGVAEIEAARAEMMDDPCSIPLERMARRIAAAIRKGEP